MSQRRRPKTPETLGPRTCTRFLEVLRKCGLSRAEYFVLAALRENPMRRGFAARIASSLSEGDPRGEVTVRLCRQAVSRCIARGLVGKVNVGVVRNDLRRWGRMENEACSSVPLVVGQLVLSKPGESVLGRVSREWPGLQRKSRVPTSAIGRRTKGTARVFSTTRAGLEQLISAIRNAPEQYFGEAARVAGVYRSTQIGRWWASRHCALRRGYRATVIVRDVPSPRGGVDT